MVDNANPSRNPVNNDSLTGAFVEVLKKFLQNTDDMIPAKIINYDRANNRAEVQPLIQVLTTNNGRISRAKIANIPVFCMGGGSFFINFNLPPGSLGWIKASDRDISLFLQSYEENPPNTYRLHSFEDSLFFPDIMKGYTIADEDDESMVIQNLDGNVKFSLNDSRIKMTVGESNIILTNELTTLNSTNFQINGDLSLDGEMTSTGDITSDTEVTAGTVNLTTHEHDPGTYVAPSGGGPLSGESGPPAP